MSGILGNVVFLWCIDRKLLSIPHECFGSLQKGLNTRKRLWPSVVQELTRARDTFLFVRGHLRAQACPTVLAVDASTIGFGVEQKVLDVKDVRGQVMWAGHWVYLANNTSVSLCVLVL